MKIIILMFSLLLSATALAETQCKHEQHPLIASYTVSSTADPSSHETVQVVRTENKIIYHYQNQSISEQWYLQKNKRIGLTRYFDQYQRGIEYQAADMPNVKQAQQTWLQKYQLVSPAILAQLAQTPSPQDSCPSVAILSSKADSKQLVDLVWDNNTQLPTTLSIKQGKHTITWQRSSLNFDAKQVAQIINKYDNYQLTDYSDIGDNEADPFLAKMINQGFIEHSHHGFYNAQGEAM